ncbi:hypothetical protein CRM22_007041 [Opisthorchis felineus]|uniref:Uncharacterized protein n=2 Tax=Opisthorchis felineus TaxID=147828 RepID=A0A4S2LI93_OPIFE|nr:hypothetical protein CRM22_007041 [Opisthorchis felineus]
MRIRKCNTMLPRYIYSKYTDGNYSEEGKRELERNLPYLNIATGLENRMVLSDPVTGLGILSDEWNPLSGNHISRKPLVQRDLIKLEGERGQEYNCLYTTKELTCRPRENRDPITLTGELGEELDPFRPHGGHPRNRMDTAPKRDPIAGTGEFGREWDPIYKYNGRSRSSHVNTAPTDPITHNLSGSNFQTNHMRKQYNERWTFRDPILHNYDEAASKSFNCSAEMRHFPQRNRSFDLITNLPSPRAVTEERRMEGTSKKGDSINAVTVQMANNSINAADRWPRYHTGRGRGLYSSQRVYRNPITGEGMKEEDYSDSVTFSRQYVLRNRPRQFGHTQSPPRVQQPESEKVVNKPIPRTQQTTRGPEPKKRLPVERTDRKQNPTETKDTTVDKTPEKKVVRPKRMPTQPTAVVENGANENGGLIVETPNQSAVEQAQPFETSEPVGLVEEVYKPEMVGNHEEQSVTPAQRVTHAEHDEPDSQHDDVFDTESSS